MARAASELGQTFDRSASAWAGEAGRSLVPSPALENLVEALFSSIAIVALAEIGDKTQLLSLALTARYRKPLPIIAGIFIATLLNHALAGAAGAWVAAELGPVMLRWVLAASFLIMAGWILVPDKLDESDQQPPGGLGVFGATTLAFFIAEMGDKTQIVTVALAAKYSSFYSVVAGTTVGMLLANVPVVLLGERIANKIPAHLVRRVAAGIFAVLGIVALISRVPA
jgi:putative Ca2+/H+ antiporter (TMEM165/GDT1 family)